MTLRSWRRGIPRFSPCAMTGATTRSCFCTTSRPRGISFAVGFPRGRQCPGQRTVARITAESRTRESPGAARGLRLPLVPRRRAGLSAGAHRHRHRCGGQKSEPAGGTVSGSGRVDERKTPSLPRKSRAPSMVSPSPVQRGRQQDRRGQVRSAWRSSDSRLVAKIERDVMPRLGLRR